MLSIVIFGAAAYLLDSAYGSLSPEALKDLINAMSWKGVAVYVIIFCLGITLFVPSMPMAVAGALVFGPWKGFAILQICSLLAASLVFVLVRFWLKPLLGAGTFQSLIPARIYSKAHQNALLLIVYGRTLKVPAPAINYGASALPISFMDYFLGSLLGSLPNNLAVAMLCGVAHDAILAGRWVALLQWELIPAVVLTLFNLYLAHRLNERSNGE